MLLSSSFPPVFYVLLGVCLAALIVIGKVVYDALRRLPIEAEAAAQAKAEVLRLQQLTYMYEVRQQVQASVEQQLREGWAFTAMYQGQTMFLEKMAGLMGDQATKQILEENARLQHLNNTKLAASNATLATTNEEFAEQNRRLREKLRAMQTRPSRGQYDEDGYVQPSADGAPANVPAIIRPLSRVPDGEDRGTSVGGASLAGSEIQETFAYRVVATAYPEKFEVLEKLTGATLLTFDATTLEKGVVREWNERGHRIRVVLCALPGCQKIRLTKHTTTRCCSQEHSRRYDLEKARLGMVSPQTGTEA